MLFTVQDYQGIPVLMTEDTWNNKLLDPSIGHPEIKPYFKYIKQTVRHPDIVYQSVRDKRSQLFIKSSVGKGTFKDIYFVVVIKYVQEPTGIHGYVSTVMFNRALPKTGTILWTNKDST